MAEQMQRKSDRKQKPVTVRIEEFKDTLNKTVAGSGLPPFLLEMLIGEYLAGISRVAGEEYARDRAEWERECEENG